MKKFLLTLLLVASLTFGLTACSDLSGVQNEDGASQTSGQTDSEADSSQEEQSGTADGTQEEQSGTADGTQEEQSGTADGSQDEEQSGDTESVSEESGQDYAVSAISAINLITSMGAESSSASAVSLKSALNANAKSVSLVSKTALETTVTDGEIHSALDGYMSIVNGILSDSSYEAENVASDREEYAVKTTLSFADMSGATVEYVMYYNETNVREYTKQNETERRSDISGILIIEGVEYVINGVSESETEGAESEYEVKFTVTLSDTGYIVITHESEEEQGESEVEYVYAQYENNVLVKRATFSYEQEADETEIEMSVYENGTTTKFYFERETEQGVEYTTIKIGSANSTEKYRVYVTENADGTYSYTYAYIGK